MPEPNENDTDPKGGAGGDAPASREAPRAETPVAAADPVAEARAEAQRMKDQWVRTAADFDNFRKRSRREVEEARKTGREELLKELLPVFDNLERGIQSAQRAQEVKAVAEGLHMILRQFVETVGRAGISKLKSVGVQFDPSVHEAIQQVETDDHPPGTVVAEVQPGYVQGERLVRAAMVVVAKPKAKPKEDEAVVEVAADAEKNGAASGAPSGGSPSHPPEGGSSGGGSPSGAPNGSAS